jgi:hypothetical protein
VPVTLERNTERPEWRRAARSLGWRGSLLAAGVALATAAAIAIPTRLVPNPLFTRMTPARAFDYLFLVASSILMGLTLAVRPISTKSADGQTLLGGLGTYLAVGCPICNKVVVALLGVGGALSIFGPVQPFLGAAAVMLLSFALRRKVLSGSNACVVAVGGGSSDRVS